MQVYESSNIWNPVGKQISKKIVLSHLTCYVCYKDPSEYRNLQHFHFLHWREDGAPWSGQTILQLICKVDSWEKEVQVHAKPYEFIGPIVVHCK